jgi:hypothetical protein
MMASLTYLGIVTSRSHRGAIPVASVRPALVSSEDRKGWARQLSDLTARREEFPNGGFVSWLYPDDSATEGTLWQFEITEQSTYFDYPDDPKRDRFMVLQHSARRVCEVIDLNGLGGEPAGRELLTVHGMGFPKGAPAACYVRVEKSLWSVPPLRLVKKPGGEKLWVIELAPSKVIRCVKWEAPVEPTEFEYYGKHLVLPPDMDPLGTAHQRDWSTDEEVLTRVFGTLRRIDRHHAEPLEPAERAIARVAQLLSGPQPAVQDVDFEAARVRRAEAFLSRLKAVQEISRAASIAIENGPLAEEIARRKEAILAEERAVARTKVEADLADERKKLQELSEQVAGQERLLGELQRTIEARRAGHEAQVGRLEEDLARRVREAIEKPEELLGSVALIRAVTGSTGWKDQPDRQLPCRGRGAQEAASAGAECTSGADLFSRLQKAFLRRDVPRALARSLQASFLAGSVPLLAGSRARDALSAYASCVTAGELSWVPVTAGWLDPADILGRVDPGSGRFIPHPCGLLDLLLGARSGDRLHLVVFDGVNRAPVESYLLPLLACHADADVSPSRSYPLPGVNSYTAGVGFPPDGRVTWPPNVLLAGTLARGSTCLPLPMDVWGHATLYLCDAIDPGPELEAFADRHPDERMSGRGEESLSFVRSSTWTGWKSECRGRILTPCVQLWAKLGERNDLPRSARDLALRFFAASNIVADDAAATADTLAHCVLPLIAQDADLASAALGDARTIYGDWSRAIREAARLTMT